MKCIWIQICCTYKSFWKIYYNEFNILKQFISIWYLLVSRYKTKYIFVHQWQLSGCFNQLYTQLNMSCQIPPIKKLIFLFKCIVGNSNGSLLIVYYCKTWLVFFVFFFEQIIGTIRFYKWFIRHKKRLRIF